MTQPYKAQAGLGANAVLSYATLRCKNGANKPLLPCKDCSSRFSGAKLQLQQAPDGLESIAVQ